MCDMHLVIFWPRGTKQISHIDQSNRIGRCAIYVVIIWPRGTYQADIAHQPVESNRWMCDMHLYAPQTIWENETARWASFSMDFAAAVGNESLFCDNLHFGQIANSVNPCGKQHFREIATPDWVRTLRTCFILLSMFRS